MTVDEIRRALAGCRDRLDEFGVGELFVFGSVARGEAGDESDVDFLVEYDQSPTLHTYMGLKYLLEEVLGRPVDLATRSMLKPLMRPSVEKDAVNVA